MSRAPVRTVTMEKYFHGENGWEWLYTVRDDRMVLRTFAYSIPLSAYWVEDLRRDPTQFDSPPEAA